MKLSDEYLNKSLLELGAWSWNREPSEIELNPDRFTIELDRISKKKLCQYTPSDIYIAVSQEKGLQYTQPMAVALLSDDLLIDCEFYPGDLLKAVLSVPTTYYQLHTDNFIRTASLCSLKTSKRVMYDYDGNRELRRLFNLWTDCRKSYWVRIITKNYQQPIDDVKEFIYNVIEDDASADVEFSDYVQYWKSDNKGEITALISTVIPFDILRKCIAEQWTPADKIGNSFVADSRIFKINCNSVYWISIDYDNSQIAQY